MLSEQAHRIAAFFGGLRKFAEAIGRDYTVVYKWTYPRKRGGTGGLIPAHAVPDVVKAAERLKVTIPANAWRP